MKQLAYAMGFINKPVANDGPQTDELQRESLKHLSGNVMIADKDHNIVYVNDTLVKFLRGLENDIKKSVPAFNASKLIGTRLDSFYDDPALQRGILDRMTDSSQTSIKLGSVLFNLRTSPIFNASRERTGTVIEWQDSQMMDGISQLAAIKTSMAVIEFELDGTIINANENFLNAMGYRLEDVKGKHHSLFVEPQYASSPEYRQFWDDLRRGISQTREFKRLAKGEREIWIQASYNPIMDLNGRPYKVVKYATDVTQQKVQNADYMGQIQAIGRSQAVIEFQLDGTIVNANSNFLDALGYRLEEIKDKHHSMFVDPQYANSTEYRQFWDDLRRGISQTREFKRYGKGGKEIWIQASYNPIMDLSGRPFKVVKYASDVTDQVMMRDKSERVKNVIMENISEIESAISSASEQSTSAARSSVETSSTVQSIAAGAEEMNSSVEEIAQSMATSKVSVDEAYEQTLTADRATQLLTNAAQSMGGIVELIQAIASQINLLALNATIESARAGDAGKGFAVVANEVKNLAMQTTTATEQISKEIDNMQTISEDVVKALSVIKDSIESVRKNVTGVASAVSEQSAVTQEMSSNMQSAAGAVTHVSNNLGEIARVTDNAKSSAKRIIEAISEN